MHSNIDWPLLYSYRRCPYAMRARMALSVAGIHYKRVEIHLRDKPSHMMRVSPKGTVPVLCLSELEVIDESLQIMHWALQKNDPLQWLDGLTNDTANQLLEQTDGPFKKALDHYKYASRFPDIDPTQSREQALGALIQPLGELLDRQDYMGGHRPVFQDVAIFPFVRQFAGVQPLWFDEHAPPSVRHWLQRWVSSELFAQIMQKPSPGPD
jgi:glutathione S-transferase